MFAVKRLGRRGGDDWRLSMSRSEPVPALINRYARSGLAEAPAAPRPAAARVSPIELSVVCDLALVEKDWRAFEREADCTVFQTFDLQSAWMKNVAPHEPVTPVIVVGRTPDREILFLIPLAVARRGFFRGLTFLATDLCDYNAPLLARDFAAHVGPGRFSALWREIVGLLRADPELSPDIVILEKMPETVGAQPNPFLELPVSTNASGAYLARLAGNWDEFYAARRSSATRRRDRTKRKRLAGFGEVRFVTPDSAPAIDATLSTLFAQKARSFARMGVPDIFARPGWAGFYRDIATGPARGETVHVSRLEIGDTLAAANLGLVHRNRYYHILASYDDGEVSKYGPGAAHLHDLMRHAIDRGCDVFDFTIGDEGYKRDWSDTVSDLHDFRSALTWRGAVVAPPLAVQAYVKRTVKQTPFLWRMATRLRAVLGDRRNTAPTPAAGDDEAD